MNLKEPNYFVAADELSSVCEHSCFLSSSGLLQSFLLQDVTTNAQPNKIIAIKDFMLFILE